MNLKTGIDIVYIPRLKQIISDTPGFIYKVFTESEIAEANRRGEKKYAFYATRFAAKEAIIKALHNLEIEFSDLEIVQDSYGKTGAEYLGAILTTIDLSISSDEDYAIACVIKAEST